MTEALKKAEIFASYKIGFDGAANGFADEQKIEELAAEIVFSKGEKSYDQFCKIKNESVYI